MSIRWSLHLHVCQSVVCSSSACLHVHFYAYPLVISFSSLSIHKPACPSVKLLSVMLICWSHYLLICPFTVCFSACQLSFHLSSSLYVHLSIHCYLHLLLCQFIRLSCQSVFCSFMSVHLHVCMFTPISLSNCCLFIHLFACTTIFMFIRWSIHLCLWPFVCVPICSSVCHSVVCSLIPMSICLSVYRNDFCSFICLFALSFPAPLLFFRLLLSPFFSLPICFCLSGRLFISLFLLICPSSCFYVLSLFLVLCLRLDVYLPNCSSVCLFPVCPSVHKSIRLPIHLTCCCCPTSKMAQSKAMRSSSVYS
jgi:hypothetical protein